MQAVTLCGARRTFRAAATARVVAWAFASVLLLLLALPRAASAQQSTGPAGGGQPHGNVQPSLALNALIRTNDSVFEKLGEIKFFAGNFAPAGYQFASGQLLNSAVYDNLFNRIGTVYGGDGVNTFALPDLRGRSAMHYGAPFDLTPVPIYQTGGTANVTLTATQLPIHTHGVPVVGPTGPAGGGQPHPNHQPYLALNYRIDFDGAFPTPGSGTVGMAEDFLGDVEISAIPTGEFDRFASLNGQLVPITQNQALFSILSTFYGGNGVTNFGLPDLRGRLPIGTGAGPGLTPRAIGTKVGAESHTLTLDEMPAHTHALSFGPGVTDPAGGGEAHDNVQPSMAMSYIIATNGMNPIGAGPDGSSFPFMGEVSLFTGDYAPAGWMIADGRLLSIADHAILFAVLGDTYGGDGVTTFALPDLRGRTIIHPDGVVYQLGDILGAETHALLASEMPAHTHSTVPEPAALGLLVLAAIMLRRRPR